MFASQLRGVLEELGTPHPGVAALALLGMLNWTLRWYDADGPLSLDELADSMFELFTRGALR